MKMDEDDLKHRWFSLGVFVVAVIGILLTVAIAELNGNPRTGYFIYGLLFICGFAAEAIYIHRNMYVRRKK